MKQIIIDTREPVEFAESHYDGAINLPATTFGQSTLPEQLNSLSKDAKIVLYCRSGARSVAVGRMIAAHGFTNIVNGINQNNVSQILGTN